MSLSYGFYNSINHDRLYNATDLSSIFDGIIQDGVYATIGEKFAVKAASEMYVTVGSGRAWFNRTWTYNDAPLLLDCFESELNYDRIDAVVLEVDTQLSTRANAIKMVKGPVGATLSKPALLHNEYVNQYALAYITIKKGATEIDDSNIEIVVGRDETPFVTGLLETTSVESLYSQWNSEFNNWFKNLEYVLDGDVAGHLQNQITANTNYITNAKQNLIPFPYYDGMSLTRNGITFTVNADGSITANGTATATVSFILNHRIDGSMILPKGTYTISGCPIGGSTTTYRVVIGKTSSTGSFEVVARDFGNGATFTLSEEADIYVGAEIGNGTTVNNLVFKPMLVEGSVAPTKFKLNGDITLVGVLSAGSTTLEIRNDKILANSIIEPPYFYVESDEETEPISYNTIKVTNGSIVMTFDSQPKDLYVGIKLS